METEILSNLVDTYVGDLQERAKQTRKLNYGLATYHLRRKQAWKKIAFWTIVTILASIVIGLLGDIAAGVVTILVGLTFWSVLIFPDWLPDDNPKEMRDVTQYLISPLVLPLIDAYENHNRTVRSLHQMYCLYENFGGDTFYNFKCAVQKALPLLATNKERITQLIHLFNKTKDTKTQAADIVTTLLNTTLGETTSNILSFNTELAQMTSSIELLLHHQGIAVNHKEV